MSGRMDGIGDCLILVWLTQAITRLQDYTLFFEPWISKTEYLYYIFILLYIFMYVYTYIYIYNNKYTQIKLRKSACLVVFLVIYIHIYLYI